MCKKWMLLASIPLIFLVLIACTISQPKPVIESEIVVEPEGPIGPNPVEIYCTGLGYEFTTRRREIDKQLQTQMPVDPTWEAVEGPQPGNPVIPDYIQEVVCVFPDGNECEEDEFRLGQCG